MNRRKGEIKRKKPLYSVGSFVLALLALAGTLSWLSREVAATSAAASVHALFDLTAPATGPFPTDWLTIADPRHNTRLRINLPKPDCHERPSDCEDIDVINTLDGFNLQPRLSVPFDGPISVETVTSQTVFLISLGSVLPHGNAGNRVIGINEVVWDPATLTLHVESDEFLDQHTRYGLIVTRGVRDVSGAPVEATEAFRQFRQTVGGNYKQALLDAIHAARSLGVREDDIGVASVFTTQSVTPVMEKIRDQIKAAIPPPADFLLGPGRRRTIFSIDDVTGITWTRQIQDNPPDFNAVPMNLAVFRIIPGAVGLIAFGRYVSPDYQTPEKFIPPIGTHNGTPVVQGANQVYFNLLLPSGPKPSHGWPVVIQGIGSAGSKQRDTFLAASLAHHGIANIVIDPVGRGFGPLGTLEVNHSGGSVTFPSGGRGIDQNGDGTITDREGEDAARPRGIISNRDGMRQTAVDLMQLVRAIEVGMDVDGDGVADLDPSRIYYSGWSFGANYGTMVLTLDASVRAATFYAPGGPIIDNRRWGRARNQLASALALRVPSLLNRPGITTLGGIAIPAPHFNENMPLRNGISYTVGLADGTSHDIRFPVTNTVAGAIEIQQLIERTEWMAQSGNQVAYMPYIRKAPLAGVPAKPIIFLYSKGDQTVANPSATAMVRAGDMADRVTFYRNDLAFAENPAIPKDPHSFYFNTTHADALVAAIARGALEHSAFFFASDGKITIHPEPARFFEVPIVLPLPEDLSYIP
jgi:hypothetical protein